MKIIPCLWLLMLCFATSCYARASTYDVVIYGGTSAGVIAAVQASRMGMSVLLIEPGKHLGGMTSSGLGWVDAGRPATIGGLTRDYFHRVWKYYQNDAAWVWEKSRPIKEQHFNSSSNEMLMWVLEPHVAEKIFEEMIAETRVTVIRRERLNRKNGVRKQKQRITHIIMESGLVIPGRMFIDATYEGDLMAAAGVSYVIGREPNSQYNETLNGVQANLRRTQMPKQLDPYRVKGVPSSGLLPRVYPRNVEQDGTGDSGVQAYNYRMCLTDVAKNLVQIEKLADYDESDYELVFRSIELGMAKEKFFKLDLLPNRKTDSNNNGPISTDYVGMSWNYAEADYSKRKQIEKEHEQWQRGLIWTLQNHPRIPQPVRSYYAAWGLPKDEFIDNNHWPFQLYIREARRMVSSVLITENMALGKTRATDGIGLGSYDMDSHAIKYFIAPDGFLVTDGGLSKKVPAPFPISYQAIVPMRQECENLLVPVCLSASHVGYASVRMEPVFMVLGQSAATAASIAICREESVQDVPYTLLCKKLLADGQVLEWSADYKIETPNKAKPPNSFPLSPPRNSK